MNQPVDHAPARRPLRTLPNGLRLHYLDEGTGPVVLWLHGSGQGASGFSNFEGQLPAVVAAGYRNIVLDLSGFRPLWTKPEDVQYNLDFFVDCVAAFLESVGECDGTLPGNSLGGAIALGLALRLPQLPQSRSCWHRAVSRSAKPTSRWKVSCAWSACSAQGPIGIEEMRSMMRLPLFIDSSSPESLLQERVAVAETQPKNL